jgi:hypothetical protein
VGVIILVEEIRFTTQFIWSFCAENEGCYAGIYPFPPHIWVSEYIIVTWILPTATDSRSWKVQDSNRIQKWQWCFMLPQLDFRHTPP